MGVDINKPINGDTVLNKVLKYMAEHTGPWCVWGNTGIKKLIQLGACVNTLDSCGLSPLFNGINNYDCVHMLVNAGADVNFSFTMGGGESGITLLHLACSSDYRIVELLLENGADVNACLLYTSPSPRDQRGSRMPSSA